MNEDFHDKARALEASVTLALLIAKAKQYILSVRLIACFDHFFMRFHVARVARAIFAGFTTNPACEVALIVITTIIIYFLLP